MRKILLFLLSVRQCMSTEKSSKIDRFKGSRPRSNVN
jgi:hypothetical protein